MKKVTLFIYCIVALFFIGCEDVVDVDLKTTPPKLVIEASIIWFKGLPGKDQKIKLTTTSDYFNPEIPVVSGATISIKNSSNTVFNFTEIPNTGEYICNNFVPQINETYILTINYNGEVYTASETLRPVAPITKIEQNNNGGFSGDQIEVKTYYNDPANETNHYLYKYSYTDEVTQSFYADEDTFFQGNEFFSISQNDDLKPGDKIEIIHFGISKSYYNYIKILINISGSVSGSPFQSPPATVRGNIINTTNRDNYALGYFSLSEVDARSYTIK